MKNKSVTQHSFISMTGFGEASSKISLSDSSLVYIRVQCKSVNHRFIDISIKSPALYSSFELDVQRRLREVIGRGRVEVSIQREVIGNKEGVKLNTEFIKAFINEVRGLSIPDIDLRDLEISALNSLWARKEVFEAGAIKDNDISNEEKTKLFELIDLSLNSLISSRTKEGAELSKEVYQQLSSFEKCIDKITSVSETESNVIFDSLKKRLNELLEGFQLKDDTRLLTELAILADKSDIREELVRAKAHISYFKDIAKEGGRKLDFLLQEMLRECNTIASKTTLSEISALVVECKSILEKIKEQVQNIE